VYFDASANLRAVDPMATVGVPLRWATLAASFLGVAFCGSPVAHAFSEPRSYFDDPAKGGGGGRWFTGSPAEGYGCSVCHTGFGPEPLYVDGLPTTGYLPGTTYDIRLAWPEFAKLATDVQNAANPQTPSMGLVAELVAENGVASGSIEIDKKTTVVAEQCEVPAGQPAAQLYSVHPAKPTAETSSCEANGLGQRCLVAVLGCGAQQLHFRWTAPPQWQGPIWFAAGFVATAQISGNPQGDAVNEMTRVLMPATSGNKIYETQLHGGCSVASTPRSTKSAAPLALGVLGLVLLALQRRKGTVLHSCVVRADEVLDWSSAPNAQRNYVGSSPFLLLLLAVLLAATSCQSSPGMPIFPNLGGANVGLFTPGSTLGAEDASRGDGAVVAAAAPVVDSPMGDRCVGTSGSPGTQGTLTVDFSTQPLGQHWGPANVGAVWIEDAAGAYIKTIERWAAIRARSLYHWSDHACISKWPEPDAVSSATMPNTQKPHHSTWSGKDLNGKVVPDGKYTLFIEVTETETNYGPMVTYEFEKGTMAQMLEPPDKPPHTGLKISYAPMP
jgi:MYXO-CTERM domain-containing protein